MHVLSIAPRRRGSAMLASITLMVVLVALATTVTNLSIASYEQQVDHRYQFTAAIAAESAANLGFRYMQQNYNSLVAPGGDLIADKAVFQVPLAAFATDTIGGLACEATITHIAGSSDEDYVFLIQGTATEGDATIADGYRRHRVEFVINTVTASGILTQVLFAIQGYNFTGAAKTDSYSSSDGDYDPLTVGWNGDLASEGSIEVDANKLPDPSDPNDDPDVKGTVTDNNEFPLPVYDFNEMLARYTPVTFWGNMNAAAISNEFGSSTMTLTASGSPYYMTSLQTGNSNTIVIEDEVRVFVNGPVNFQQTAFVYPDDDGKLWLYQNDYEGNDATEFKLNGNDFVGKYVDNGTTFTAEADRFLFFSEYDGQMSLNGNGVFSGVMFAPNAVIKLNGTFDFFGSIIARAFGNNVSIDQQGIVNGAFEFHYDECLADLDLNLVPRLIVSGWRSYTPGFHQD